MKRFRVNADTSVFGGCFDDEFVEASMAFFDAVRGDRFVLVVSPTVLAELQRAPEQVRKVLVDLPTEAIEFIYSPREVVASEE